jgi:hypothetical protein
MAKYKISVSKCATKISKDSNNPILTPNFGWALEWAYGSVTKTKEVEMTEERILHLHKIGHIGKLEEIAKNLSRALDYVSIGEEKDRLTQLYWLVCKKIGEIEKEYNHAAEVTGFSAGRLYKLANICKPTKCPTRKWGQL